VWPLQGSKVRGGVQQMFELACLLSSASSLNGYAALYVVVVECIV
jgi:hypothetical protein